MKIAAPRNDFGKRALDEADLPPEPMALFERWWQEAVEAQLIMPDAAVLSTVNNNHEPNARVLFIKDFNELGFVFFTNYNSVKGQELAHNNRAHLTILWAEFERQVRIFGTVEKTSIHESEQYFHTRPRGAQIGAWASQQSQEISSRNELEAVYQRVTVQFAENEIPCPPHWGGYRLSPVSIEFWQGRTNRLHDRLVYTRTNAEWYIRRMYP